MYDIKWSDRRTWLISNPYKEWIEDRQKDALADIVNIAILYDKWKEEPNASDIMYIFFEVKEILEKGDWI